MQITHTHMLTQNYRPTLRITLTYLNSHVKATTNTQSMHTHAHVQTQNSHTQEKLKRGLVAILISFLRSKTLHIESLISVLSLTSKSEIILSNIIIFLTKTTALRRPCNRLPRSAYACPGPLLPYAPVSSPLKMCGQNRLGLPGFHPGVQGELSPGNY